MSMYDILAKMAALGKTEEVIKESATPQEKDAITEAAEKLEKKFKDWEAEKEPRAPTEKEKAEDAELKAKGKETAKTLAKIASAFEKKKADESVAEGNIDDLNDRRAAKADDEEWTTGTGGRAVRKGHVTTHYAGKGVYGGGKPYKHGEVEDDNDEDNKLQAEPTAPKKRGRPKKVRDAALREKAVSRAQQQAAAIAMHAPKSELRGASKEMAKMPKKELEKFASTKHKGLPKHVKESREQLVEGLDAIAHRYGKEMRDFAQTGELAEPLFDALYDFYFDDMPYEVKKARTADPYEWISDKLDAAIRTGEVEVREGNLSTPTTGVVMAEEPIEIVDTTMENFDDLNELARLAGLGIAEATSCKSKKMTEDDVEEGNEFTKALADAKAAGKKEFEVGGKTYKVEESVGECMGNMSPMGSMPTQDNVSITTNFSSADGRKTVSVNAEGEHAEALMQMLKLAGMLPGGNKEAVVAQVAVAPEEVEVEVKEEEMEYSNSPDEQYQSTDAIIHQGNDLNREKKQYASKPKLGDNPMAEDVLTLESKLAAEYESIKKAAK